MNTEEWCQVAEFCGFAVSSRGRVVELIDQRYLTAYTHSRGYLHVKLGYGERRKNRFVHRLVALAFIPNPEGKSQVNHLDGNKQNNAVENLEWATCAENIRHAVNAGLAQSGDRHHSAKLTNAQVIEAQSLHAVGATCAQLKRKYGVTWSSMSKALNNKRRAFLARHAA